MCSEALLFECLLGLRVVEAMVVERFGPVRCQVLAVAIGSLTVVESDSFSRCQRQQFGTRCSCNILAIMGPRSASALRDLSKTLDRARFDLEIDWQQPSRTTRRVKVSAATAAYIAATVENTNLDERPVQLVGEYLTVSAVSSWIIQDDDGEAVTVRLGHIGAERRPAGSPSATGSASRRS